MTAIDELEYGFITQGFLMALAEIVRKGGPAGLVGEILVDRRLGVREFVAFGIEPHDVRELLKALPKATILPFQRRGGADSCSTSVDGQGNGE